MRISAFFLLIGLFVFTSPAFAQNSAADQVLQQLHQICITKGDGISCIKLLKRSAGAYAEVHASQFKDGTQVSVRNRQFADNAKNIVGEFCQDVIGTKKYKMDTVDSRKAMIAEVTGNIKNCLKALRATQEKDPTGKVLINEKMMLALYYYNQCLRGIVDPDAKRECETLHSQALKAR